MFEQLNGSIRYDPDRLLLGLWDTNICIDILFFRELVLKHSEF